MTRASTPVGAHVLVGGGLATDGLRNADDVGAEAVQVFVGNPRGWRRSAGDPAQDAAFVEGLAERGVPLFVHTPFLVNVGSPTQATVDRSIEVIAADLARGAQLGARGVVVHAGSAVDEDRYEAALRQLRERLLPVLDALPDDGPRLLVEPTAGGGRSLAATVEDLGPYLAALDGHPMVGVCLDTCHAWAAGHDLATPGGTAATLDALEAAVGPGRLGLVHANDSLDGRGSRRDRHATIGEGSIGLPAFAELVRHPAVAGVPVVVETPSADRGHARDIALLSALRDGRPVPEAASAA
ncbi:Endonuclease IV [Geodermatophilus obscurus]|uniref:Probable endonuclease 4 n=1 Tax=Geodermatophilus obscurus TaxID=1861 RepID=A0A1I5FW82_9ACTN|nr:deoxyribonuclease IV [Geodermatophilus obscurus]SFO28027.1 Endonuclease IV [Geodermatophilus obscurus]